MEKFKTRSVNLVAYILYRTKDKNLLEVKLNEDGSNYFILILTDEVEELIKAYRNTKFDGELIIENLHEFNHCISYCKWLTKELKNKIRERM